MATERLCSVEGCGKAHVAKGWCGKHYDLLRDGPRCAAEGCDLPAKVNGFCRPHDLRAKRHGDPLAGRTPPGKARAWIDAHVDHDGEECLIWPFGRKQKGYGAIQFDGENSGAHRLMCILAHGEPPSPSHEAAHSCGNGHEGCVNPRHLRWATFTENVKDSVRHGTHPALAWKGEKHPSAKLTGAQVMAIRAKLEEGSRVTDIAALYGVAKSTISGIKSGDKWPHLMRVRDK